MRRVEACLNEVLAFGLGDERLELRGSKGVYEPGLGHDEQEDLGAGEGRELVRLGNATQRAKTGERIRTRQKGRRTARTFFMIPAFRFEKVM